MSLEQFIWPGLVLVGTAAAAGGFYWLSRSGSKSSPVQQSSSNTAPSKTPAVASDNDWTRASAPLVRVVSKIAPGQPYLWAPRLSEFMAVEERYRGTEKAVAETQRAATDLVGAAPRLQNGAGGHADPCSIAIDHLLRVLLRN